MVLLKKVKKVILLLLIYLLWLNTLLAQTVSGNLSLLANQEIKLEGFKGFKTYLITTAILDNKGNFNVIYSDSDYGIGYLISADQTPLIVILSGEDIEIIGKTLSHRETLKISKGRENQWFEQYAQEQPRIEQALTAWNYLKEMYKSDSLFAVHEKPKEAIIAEIQRIKEEDVQFLDSLPENSLVRWYLHTRNLVSSVSTVAQYRTNEIPSTITAFRTLDYTNSRLYKSGLFKDAIESHFWLLENSGKSLDSVYIEMQLSIDTMIINLIKDEKKLNEVTNYLFDLLERHSLFRASEYLALKVLNQVSCSIDSDLEKQLETYRAMKKGNVAPDIIFKGDNYTHGHGQTKFPKKLSDIKAKYTVVVFGASWCPKCTEELSEIAKYYSKWKEQDVEVVFVSLDETKEEYKNFVKDFPFFSTCDFKKWESPIINDYYVFGTPTMYLLNEKREILLRPNSVNHMNAWVDWVLLQGNK